MLGSSIVSLPWAFQNAGFVLGTSKLLRACLLSAVISIITFIVCTYTCILIVKTAGNDETYYDTLYKFYGKPGWYAGLVSTTVLMLGAVCVYFVIMAELLYPLIMAIVSWSSGHDYPLVTEPRFDEFS